MKRFARLRSPSVKFVRRADLALEGEHVQVSLTAPAKPRGWVARPCTRSPAWPPMHGLHRKGLATLDIVLPRTGDVEAAANQVLAATRWLRAQPEGEHIASIGLLGVEQLAAAVLWAGALGDPAVSAVVASNGRYDRELLARLGGLTAPTRLIAARSNVAALASAHGVMEVLASPHELIVVPRSQERLQTRLALEWFLNGTRGGRRGSFEQLFALLSLGALFPRRRLALSGSTGALLLALATPAAHAATIEVGNGCTLADAITAANSDTAVGGCSAGDSADTIVLQGVEYPLDTNYGTSLEAIESEITIEGNGATLNAQGKFRVFDVVGGSLAIESATITGGNSPGPGGQFAQSGGAIRIYNPPGFPSRASLTISHSTISGNESPFTGGAIFARADYGGVVEIAIAHSVISGNTAAGDGGALYLESYAYSLSRVSTVIQDSKITGNTSSAFGFGGAISNYAATFTAAELTILDSTISGNTTAADGGGGAISNWAAYSGLATTTIRESEISGNTAGGSGGGIYNYAFGLPSSLYYEPRDLDTSAELNVVNSTISGNVSGGGGGAVANFAISAAVAPLPTSASVTLANATLSGNTATEVGSGIYSAGCCAAPDSGIAGAAVTIKNSIITNSFDGDDCRNVDGTINGDNNLIDDHAAGDCSGVSTEAVTNFDPTLAANFGSTKTHALRAGSNAIDAGIDECDSLATDQRGVTRPTLGSPPGTAACDIGSFEFEPPLFADGFESGDTTEWD